MKLYEDRLKAIRGYEEGKVDAIDPEASGKALAYKTDFHFIPIDHIGFVLYVTAAFFGVKYAAIFTFHIVI